MWHIHCAVNIAKMAKYEPREFIQNVVEKLLDALQALPHVHTNPPIWEGLVAGQNVDAEIDFRIEDRSFRLLIEVKKSVFPRDVRDILWQFGKYGDQEQQHHNGPLVPLLAAESISTGAKELLRNKLVGYYDTGGSLFIPSREVFIYIDKAPPQPLEKAVRTLFKGKRAQVLQALLHDSRKWFGVKELAELAKASPSTTSETLTALERFEWIDSKGQGPSKERRLVQPGALLDEWKKQVLASRPTLARRYYVSGTDLEELTSRIAGACEAHKVEYAITQEVAAQRYAPFLSSISRVACRMAPGRAADAVLSELSARVVTEGANLIVIETNSQAEFLFKNRIDSVWLAGPVQVYLDLLRAGGRAPDMAEHLRREKIGY
jgi:hypothetical protein